MTEHDVYAWRTVEEMVGQIRAANSRAARSYEDGQRSIMNRISQDGGKKFTQTLSELTYHLAKDVAQRHIIPQAIRHRETYEQADAQARAETDRFMRVAEPIISHVAREGDLSFRMDQMTSTMETSMVFSVDIPPARYHVAARF
jgi:hypothetical protein